MSSTYFLKKRYNKILSLISRLLRLTVPLGVPNTVTIETTSFCQLGCKLCPIGSKKLKRKQSHLSLENFKKIIDYLPNYVDLNLSTWGEPFLTPKFLDMVEYAKKKGFIRINICTNGNCVIDKNYARRIVNSGLTGMIIAFDGYDQESYVKYRERGDFKKLSNFVKLITQQKKELGAKFPILELRQHIFSHNEKEIEKMSKMAHKLGADKFKTKKIRDLRLDFDRTFRKFLPKNKKLSRFDRKNKDNLFTFQKYACAQLWNYMHVTSDGKLTTCCFDPEARYSFGDIKSNLIVSWKKDLAKFRKSFKKDYKKINICRICLSGDYIEY